MSHSCKIYNPEKRLHHEFFYWKTDFVRIFEFIENYLCFLYFTSDLMKILPPKYLELVQFIHKQGRKIELLYTDLDGNWYFPFGYAIVYLINQEDKLRNILKHNPVDIKVSKPRLLNNWSLFVVLYCFAKKKLVNFIYS